LGAGFIAYFMGSFPCYNLDAINIQILGQTTS
jgi:hypothetical protein